MNELWETPVDVAPNQPAVEVLRKHGGKAGPEACLHSAVFRGNMKWVKRHVTSGTDLNALSGGELPLCLALRRNNLEATRYLLRKKPDVRAKEADGETALHVAARCSASPEMITALIRAGGDVDALDEDGDTPLCCAAYAGNSAAVEFLIKHGVDTEGHARQYARALACAVEGDHFEIARFLIDQGARPSIHQAAKCGHLAAVRKLIQEGVDLNQPSKDWDKDAPLALAVSNDWPEIVELLLESGAEPNLQEERHYGRDSVYGGDTALHHAVYCGSARMVKLLLAHGADPDIQDAEGLSPLEIAKRRGNTHLVHVMEAHLDRKQTEKALEQLYTVHKLAELLSVEEAFVLNLVKTGKLRQIKLDAETVRIPASSVARFLASLR
jgi:cytohesin